MSLKIREDVERKFAEATSVYQIGLVGWVGPSILEQMSLPRRPVRRRQARFSVDEEVSMRVQDCAFG